jgi:hypothetical protein
VHHFACAENPAAHELFRHVTAAGQSPDSRRCQRVLPRLNMAQDFQLGGFLFRVFFGRSEIQQVGTSRVRQPIFAPVANLDFRWQHCAKRLAHWREIVAAHPMTELDEFRRQRGERIHQFSNFANARNLRGAIGDGEA